MNDNPERLRQYLGRMEPKIRAEENREEVRIMARRLVNEIDEDGHFKLMHWANAIPVDVFANAPGPRGIRWIAGKPMVPKDDHTIFAVEHLLEAAAEAIQQIEALQAKIAANGLLLIDDRRELALKAIAEIDEAGDGEPMWFTDVFWAVGLSVPHLKDSLEHWRDCEAIRSALTDEPDGIRRFRLTPKGRKRAVDGPTDLAVAGAVSNVHFHAPGSVQQIGGHNVAHVQTVNVANLPDAVAQIEKLLPHYSESEREEVRDYLAVIEEEQRGAQRPTRIKSALRAIQRLTIETQKTFAPTIEAIVSGIVGALT